MNKEEIKEYLKRVDELEIKLTGEDKDTYQWLLFGYNECARLLNEKEQENKELQKQIEVLEWDNNDKKGIEVSYLDLLEENKELKEQLANASNNYTKYIQERDNKIDKAIEYIKRFDIQHLHEVMEHNLVEVLEVLLEILKDSDVDA